MKKKKIPQSLGIQSAVATWTLSPGEQVSLPGDSVFLGTAVDRVCSEEDAWRRHGGEGGGSWIGAQGKGAMDGACGAVYALREGPAQGQETARGPLGPWRALISPPSRVRRSFVQRGY